MKLLVFTENYARGGGNRYVVDLVNGMAPEFDEIVMASNPGGLFPEDLARLTRAVDIAEVPVLTSSRFRLRGGFSTWVGRAVSAMDPLAMALNAHKLQTFIRAQSPDVLLVCNGGFPAGRSVLAAAIAGRRVGIPVGMIVVGMPVARRERLASYEASVDRRVWDSVDTVAVSGTAILDRLQALRGLESAKGRVIANALEDRGPQHAESEDGPVVGCVARITRSKGMVELAGAFVALAEDFPRARLRIVGEGPALDEVRHVVERAGLAKRAAFPGFVSGDDAVAGEVAGIDIYVLPTYGELHPAGEEGGGPPYSILEAMRAGTAIVTTRVGSISDGVTDGVEGLLVPAQDADALARAIRRLLDDPELRRDLGRAARARFLRSFTLEPMHERARELARDLVARTI